MLFHLLYIVLEANSAAVVNAVEISKAVGFSVIRVVFI